MTHGMQKPYFFLTSLETTVLRDTALILAFRGDQERLKPSPPDGRLIPPNRDGRMNAAKILIGAGADLEAKNKDG